MSRRHVWSSAVVKPGDGPVQPRPASITLLALALFIIADILRPLCPFIRSTFRTHHEDERKRRSGRRVLALTIAGAAAVLHWHLLNPRQGRRR